MNCGMKFHLVYLKKNIHLSDLLKPGFMYVQIQCKSVYCLAYMN